MNTLKINGPTFIIDKPETMNKSKAKSGTMTKHIENKSASKDSLKKQEQSRFPNKNQSPYSQAMTLY